MKNLSIVFYYIFIIRKQNRAETKRGYLLLILLRIKLFIVVLIITLLLNLYDTILKTGLRQKRDEGETGYTYLYTRQTN